MVKLYWELKLIKNKKSSFLYFLKDKIQFIRYPFNSKCGKIFPFLKKNFKHKIDQNDQKKPFQSSKDAKIVSSFFKGIICDYLRVGGSSVISVEACYPLFDDMISILRKKSIKKINKSINKIIFPYTCLGSVKN